jgi:4-carboxymuconolactone decarboxylase
MRVPTLAYDDLTEEQKAVWDEIVAGPRGKVSGPFFVWLHRPELLSRGQALGLYCRFNSGLPARLSELIILIVSSTWEATIEWHDHAPKAIELGLDADAIEALRVRAPATFKEADEQATYEFVLELLQSHKVSDATYQRALATLGQDLVIDVVGVAGYYCMIAMTLNAFEIALPVGIPNPFGKG